MNLITILLNKNATYFLLFALCSINVHSQNVTLFGNVTDTSEDNISEATIVINDSSGKIVNYSFTDRDGKFVIKFKKLDNYQITISYIGYNKIAECLDDYYFPNDQCIKKYTLIPNTQLSEIIIKPENVEPDTINFDFGKLNVLESDKLESILKKNPNFKIDNDGFSIIYKGKSIDKILINGKETFNYQNSIALDKIENRMISKLQVINNYQNKFSLDREAPDETVINIDSRDTFKDVYTGDIAGGYGIKEKFNINGSLMRFSTQYNGFIVNNTNNTGTYTFKFREIQNLFGRKNMLSSIFAESLNELFTDEDMRKNFTSNTNFTFRKQTDKYRLNSVVYYINADRDNDIEHHNSFADGTPIATSINTNKYNYNTVFVNNSIDYILKYNQILTFLFDFNLIKKQNSSNITNYHNDSAQEMANQMNTTNESINRSVGSNLSYSYSISKNQLLTIETSLHHENIDIANGFFGRSGDEIYFNQDLKYKKTGFAILTFYRRKIIDGLNIALRGNYENNVEDLSSNNRIINRGEAEILISGKKISKKIDYNISLSYQNTHIKYNNTIKKNDFFPYSLDFTYESRLNRFNFEIYNRSLINSIESGSDLLKQSSILLIGDSQNPMSNTTIKNVSVGYSYDNIFLGQSFRTNLSYQKIDNQIKEGYYNVDDKGLYRYLLLVSPKSENYSISIGGAKNLFKFTSFPIKTDLILSYSYIKSPIYVSGNFLTSNTNQVKANLRLQSISMFPLNGELDFSFIPTRTNLSLERLKSLYFKSYFKLMYRNNKVNSEIKYSLFADKVMNQNYKRQSLDILAEYKINKLTIGLEGKNIDQLISLFNNGSYNTRYTLLNGINQVSVLNEAISYLIIKLKYNF